MFSNQCGLCGSIQYQCFYRPNNLTARLPILYFQMHLLLLLRHWQSAVCRFVGGFLWRHAYPTNAIFHMCVLATTYKKSSSNTMAWSLGWLHREAPPHHLIREWPQILQRVAPGSHTIIFVDRIINDNATYMHIDFHIASMWLHLHVAWV